MMRYVSSGKVSLRGAIARMQSWSPLWWTIPAIVRRRGWLAGLKEIPEPPFGLGLLAAWPRGTRAIRSRGQPLWRKRDSTSLLWQTRRANPQRRKPIAHNSAFGEYRAFLAW